MHMYNKNNKLNIPRRIFLVFSLISILILSPQNVTDVQASSAVSAGYCYHTQYIQNKFKLSGGATGGFVSRLIGFEAYLKEKGFYQLSTPKVGAVVVMKQLFGQEIGPGHVAVISSISDLGSNWQITTKGAFQSGTQTTDNNCYNVTTKTWGKYPKTWGYFYITYWYRPGTVLSTGWEDGQLLGFNNIVINSNNVAGYYNNFNPGPEAGRVAFENWATPYYKNGSRVLRVAGYSRASSAYVYYKLFNFYQPIQNGMKLTYYIYAYKGRTFAIDGHFTDGSTIRDLYNSGYLRDQRGIRIHPAYQGYYGTGYWRYVEVDLSLAEGKTLDYLMVAFDNGNNGFKGQFRAYIDNIQIKNAP